MKVNSTVKLTDSKLTAEVDLLRPEFAKVKVTAGKMSYSKTVKVQTLIDILNGCKKESVKVEKMPRTPQGMIDLWYGQDTDFTVTIFVPRDLRPTAYLKEGNERMIPYPNLLFVFKVAGGNIADSKVFAVKVPRARAVTDDTELYRFPYGNVWTDGGKICWGGNASVVRHKGLSDMEEVVAAFFNATMNNDLYNEHGLRGGGNVTLKLSLEELLDKMAKEDVFPDKLLVSTGKKYSSIR